jgi:AcrR family transcriptional regulator
MAVGAVTGLRERKKQETRERILARARELFDERGFAETTIPEIAAAADVSPRTVSSYFPQKEELVFPDKDEMLSALSRALDDRPADEMATDALRRWLIDNFACDDHEDRHDWARALIDGDPDLRAYERVLQERAQEVVAMAVAVDLSLPPDHHLPQMVAATAMAALDSLGRDETATHDPERARGLIEDAMHFVGAGVKELRGG